MSKIKWVFIASLIIMLVALPVFAACAEAATDNPTTTPPTTPTTPPPPPKTLYIGGYHVANRRLSLRTRQRFWLAFRTMLNM